MLLLIGFCFTTFTQFGFGTWTAPFLGRIHHLNTAQIGTYSGVLRSIAGLVGTLGGGYLSDWAGRKDMRWESTCRPSLRCWPFRAFCYSRSRLASPRA